MEKNMSANDKMVELKDVIVTINGEEYNLGELTYEEFSVLMSELDDEEAARVLDEVVKTVGEEQFIKFLAKLQLLAEMEEMEDEEEEVERKEDKKEKPKEEKGKQPVILDPVRMVDMNDFYSYDPELVVQGIDSVSEKVGQYMAFVNAGLTNQQAYELITIEDKRKHELEMANKQLELERLKIEAQLRAKGISQLLNR